VARSAEKLPKIKSELEEKHGISVCVIVKDLTLHGAAQEVYDAVKEQKIEIDYLINNAGFGYNRAFVDTDWERLGEMIDLDVKALVHLTHLFLSDMLKAGSGKILNTASIAAYMPGPYMAVYCAAKSFVLSFSQAVNRELRNTGVTVTAVSPGPTESNFMAVSTFNESPMLKGKKLPSPTLVAQIAYKAMLKGKRNVIPGWWNKVMIFALAFIPNAQIVNIAAAMMKR
jgi:short-subunit dehydrogenase